MTNNFGSALERVRPETVGIQPRSLLRLTDALNNFGFTVNSMVLVKNGRVAFEIYYKPFAADIPHHLASCSKSVTSTAVGFAAHEKLFSLDDKVADLLPEKLDGAPHAYAAAMEVRHLLTMSAAFSVFKDPVTDDWTREFLNAAPDRCPGTVFTYDTSATHTLCEIVQKFSKTTVLDYLTPRLFGPLGARAEWEVSPTGVNRGGGGVRLTTEGMAKFGLLYLNGGKLNGRQILPPGWAEEAVKGRISSAASGGAFKPRYGYQFWRIRDDGFCCLGMGGQVIAMFPEHDLVFAVTANGLQHNYDYLPLDLMCEFVLPEAEAGSVPYDDENYKKLTRFCESAEVFMPNGAVTSPAAGRVNGKMFYADVHPGGYTGFKIIFNESGNDGKLILYKNAREETLDFGVKTHAEGNAPWQQAVKDCQFFGKYSFPGEESGWLRSRCGSSAVWADERTLVIKCHMLEQLQSFIVTCHFGDKAAVLNIHPVGVYEYLWLPLTLTCRT